MGCRRVAVVLAVAFAARAARADEIDDLVIRGKALAKAGELTQAIAQFRRADAMRPRAQHACLIGLAYTRRELWLLADLWFARCRARANANDPLPEWFDEAEQQLAAKVSAARAATITIRVAPASAHATVKISSFDFDEVLAPGTIHLAPGRYTLEAGAPGFARQKRTIVAEDGAKQTIAITLSPVARWVPWAVLAGGVALVTAGAAFDAYELQPLKTEIAKSRLLYDERSGAFDAWRAATVGSWITGAIAIGVGTYLVVTKRARFTAEVDRSRAVVLVELSR
jgi:hypothetical protein